MAQESKASISKFEMKWGINTEYPYKRVHSQLIVHVTDKDILVVKPYGFKTGIVYNYKKDEYLSERIESLKNPEYDVTLWKGRFSNRTETLTREEKLGVYNALKELLKK